VEDGEDVRGVMSESHSAGRCKRCTRGGRRGGRRVLGESHSEIPPYFLTDVIGNIFTRNPLLIRVLKRFRFEFLYAASSAVSVCCSFLMAEHHCNHVITMYHFRAQSVTPPTRIRVSNTS
jgi:hypothetical protein